jgi:hypothetical protein
MRQKITLFVFALSLNLLAHRLLAQNVGIGTNLPFAKLDVYSLTNANPLAVTGANGMYCSLFEDGVYRGYFGSYYGSFGLGNNSDIDFGTGVGNSFGSLHFTIQANPKMTLLPNGYVGVGTTNPTQLFHVNGAIKLGNSAINEIGSIRFNSGNQDFEGFRNNAWSSLTGSNKWLRSNDTIFNPATTKVVIGDKNESFLTNFLTDYNPNLILVDTTTVANNSIFTNNLSLVKHNGTQASSGSKYGLSSNFSAYSILDDPNFEYANSTTAAYLDNRSITNKPGSASTYGIFSINYSKAGGAIGGYFQTSTGDSSLGGDNIFAVSYTAALQASAGGFGSSNKSIVYGLRAAIDSGGRGRKYAGYFSVAGNGLGADTALKWAGFFNGNVAYTGTLSFASDERLKKNIAPLQGALHLLLQLQPKTYEFDATKAPGMQMAKGLQFGLLAGEVEQVAPQLVSNNIVPASYSLNEKMEHQLKTPENSYKGVHYLELIPVLIKGMQEQQQIIESLKAEIERLKNK